MSKPEFNPCPVCKETHRGQCSRCPHHAHVMAGVFSSHDYEKTPCSACAGCADVPTDERELFETAQSVNDQAEATPRNNLRAHLLEFFEYFMRLSALERDILCWHLLNRDDEIVAYARKHGIASQSAHRALTKAKAKFPMVAALLRVP